MSALRRLPNLVARLAPLALVAAAACGGSSGGADPAPRSTVDPDVSLGTVPPAVTEPQPGERAGPTTSLVPSAEADLPTAAPGATTPTNTAALPTGPLPIPAVFLLEVGQFEEPVGLAAHPIDPRLFVAEQAGRVVAIDDESATTVADLSELIDAGGERGLLGLAFHPGRDLAYVNYTDLDGNTVVAEFAVDPVTTEFDPGSFREVLTVEQPFGNHNGGALAFGPDQLLYIGLGDGGSAGDPLRAGLDLTTRLGKLLRIDPIAFGDDPFVVPPDNPFAGVDGADPTIWSLGLRNPWRISFDPATGDLWIADVGQSEFEEIDQAPAVNGRDAGRGLSFGWSAFEGDTPFNADQPTEGHTPPVIVYAHDDGNCSVSGGNVARESGVVDLDGWFVYGDFCSGTIWGYDTTSPADAPVIVELAELPQLAAIATGPDGALYAVSNGGTLARLTSS